MLFGKEPKAQRNGQPNNQHVYKQSLSQSRNRKWADREWNRGERQNNQIHNHKNSDAIEQTTNKKMLSEEFKFPTGNAIQAGRQKRDQKVKHNTEYPGANAPAKCLRPKQTTRNATRHAPPKRNERSDKIKGPGREPARKNGEQNPPPLNRQCAQRRVHSVLCVDYQASAPTCRACSATEEQIRTIFFAVCLSL